MMRRTPKQVFIIWSRASHSHPTVRYTRIYTLFMFFFFLSQNIILDYNNNDTSVIYCCYLLCENREKKNSTGYTYNKYLLPTYITFSSFESRKVNSTCAHKRVLVETLKHRTIQEPAQCTMCSKDVIYNMVLSFCRHYIIIAPLPSEWMKAMRWYSSSTSFIFFVLQ